MNVCWKHEAHLADEWPHFGSNAILVECAFNTALVEVFQTEFHLFIFSFIYFLDFISFVVFICHLNLPFFLPKNGLVVFTAQAGLCWWFKSGFEQLSNGKAGIQSVRPAKPAEHQFDQAERPAKPHSAGLSWFCFFSRRVYYYHH